MSEILSEEVVEVVKARKTKLAGIKCDCCETVIPADIGCRDNNRYYRVTTGHHDWGNDSCESVEGYDICPCCIGGFVNTYLKDTEYDSAYIEVERRYAYPRDRWLD